MNQLYDGLWRIARVNWLLCCWRGDCGRKPPADQRTASPHLVHAVGRINTVECNCKPHSVCHIYWCQQLHTPLRNRFDTSNCCF